MDFGHDHHLLLSIGDVSLHKISPSILVGVVYGESCLEIHNSFTIFPSIGRSTMIGCTVSYIATVSNSMLVGYNINFQSASSSESFHC